MRIYADKKCIALNLFSIFLFASFSCVYAIASISYYPTGEWHISTPEDQGVQSKYLLAASPSFQFAYPLNCVKNSHPPTGSDHSESHVLLKE
jgi:hypothetical protein